MVHNYTVSGSLILTEEWGTNLVVYLYDANGEPIGMRYRTSSMAEGVFYTFWFDKNLQGDVVAVYTETGTKVLSYIYDAWGNKTTTVHSSSGSNSYAQYNAITYRGYYFDSEISLYYVSSRYYDAKIGRFVNADAVGLLGANRDFVSLNLFAYCGNNPVSREDDGGKFWHIVIGAAIGAAANAASKIVENLFDNNPETDWNDGLGLAIVTGAVTGGVAVTGLGPAVQMAVNAAATAIEGLPDVVKDIKNGKNVYATLGGYAFDVGISAVTSYSPGLGSKAVTNLGKQTVKRTANTFVHDGIQAGIKELGAAAKWYWKSAKTYIGEISKEQAKGLINGWADGMIRDRIF